MLHFSISRRHVMERDQATQAFSVRSHRPHCPLQLSVVKRFFPNSRALYHVVFGTDHPIQAARLNRTLRAKVSP